MGKDLFGRTDGRTDFPRKRIWDLLVRGNADEHIFFTFLSYIHVEERLNRSGKKNKKKIKKGNKVSSFRVLGGPSPPLPSPHSFDADVLSQYSGAQEPH